MRDMRPWRDPLPTAQTLAGVQPTLPHGRRRSDGMELRRRACGRWHRYSARRPHSRVLVTGCSRSRCSQGARSGVTYVRLDHAAVRHGCRPARWFGHPMNRPCLGPSDGSAPCPTRSVQTATRCEPCRLQRERTRRPPTAARGYDAPWQAFSRGQRDAEPWCHTVPRCPYPDSGMDANPLTVDHATLGLVLCRRCNSAKQHADRGVGRVSGTSDRP